MRIEGQAGRLVEGIRVRFGGVENLEQLRATFSSPVEGIIELASFGYSKTTKSKPGKLVCEISFERIDLKLEVRCHSLQITGPT